MNLPVSRCAQRRSPVLALLLAFGLAGISLSAAQDRSEPSQPQMTVLRAARMLDPKSGEVVRKAVVVVAGDKIKAAGTALAVPAGARIIELGDVMLVPGLIDGHSHLMQNFEAGNGEGHSGAIAAATMSTAQRVLLGVAMAREYLEAGITTVRDLGGGGLNGDVQLRDAISAGWVVGPRIFAATRPLAPTAGLSVRLNPEAQGLFVPDYRVVNGRDGARQAVREAVDAGADLIKVRIDQDSLILSQEEVTAIAEEAHRLGRKVAAHATGTASTRIAVQAEVDSIEHAYAVTDEVLKVMARKRIYLVATDYPIDYYMQALSPPDIAPEHREQLRAQVEKFAASSRDRFVRAVWLGVPIAFGSDEYYDLPGLTRGQTSLLTLQAYQAAGMSQLDAIRTATVNAADLLGRSDQLGTIEAGKLADLIAVAGDPLNDVADLQKVKFVMKGGKVFRDERTTD